MALRKKEDDGYFATICGHPEYVENQLNELYRENDAVSVESCTGFYSERYNDDRMLVIVYVVS